MIEEYQKIETVYERSEDGKRKLIDGKFRNPIVKYLENNEWYFTEKVDGTNIRVCWDGHKISFRGRTDASKIPPFLEEKLKDIFHNDPMEQMFEQLFEEKEAIFFGEGYGDGIQKTGNLYKNRGVDFIVFDLMTRDEYVSRKSTESICSKLGLDIIPIYGKGKLNLAIELVKNKPNSSFGNKNFPIEGLAGVPTVPIYDQHGKRVIVKIKVKDFCDRENNI